MNPILVVGALIERKSQEGHREILIFRRASHVRGAGEWEFPGGKVEPGEEPTKALEREIQEELSLQIKVHKSLGEVSFAKQARTLQLSVYICEILNGDMQLSEHDLCEWVRPENLDLERLSAPDRPFIQRYLNHGSK